jgi:hypothetical protein
MGDQIIVPAEEENAKFPRCSSYRCHEDRASGCRWGSGKGPSFLLTVSPEYPL